MGMPGSQPGSLLTPNLPTGLTFPTALFAWHIHRDRKPYPRAVSQAWCSGGLPRTKKHQQKDPMKRRLSNLTKVTSLALATLVASAFMANAQQPGKSLPTHAELQTALKAVVAGGNNAGFALNMWATVVNRDGGVIAVAFTGKSRGDQWPGSRVISAQKAYTANAFSLPKLALSTANLYSAVQPGGTLFGLQHSNPVDAELAYRGPADNWGTANDPMMRQRIGGINVFGGGLPLYSSEGVLLGAIGVSGDTSCTDHIVAWKVRHALNLDNVPAGVSQTKDDNIVHDITEDAKGHEFSPSGWGHPEVDAKQKAIAEALPKTHPKGPNP
jgi:uncharacterized protein GlcG (DUF336 family)